MKALLIIAALLVPLPASALSLDDLKPLTYAIPDDTERWQTWLARRCPPNVWTITDEGHPSGPLIVCTFERDGDSVTTARRIDW
jgi:hypothetical protein